MSAFLAIICTVLVVVIIDYSFKIEDLTETKARTQLRKKLYRAMRVNFAAKRGLAEW